MQRSILLLAVSILVEELISGHQRRAWSLGLRSGFNSQYGHHHPDHLREAANAIGSRKPVSLVISLVNARERRKQAPQTIENIGGGRSPSRTRLYSQIPC